MKKLLALLLCVLLVVSMLAACGNKDDDDDDDKKSTKATTSDAKGEDTKATTDSNKETTGKDSQTIVKPDKDNKNEVAVGTILDAPEVVFDFDNSKGAYFRLTVKTTSGVESIDLVATENLVYAGEYPAGEQYVFEIGDNGITAYGREDSLSTFEKAEETDISQDELESMVMEFASIANTFLDPVSTFAGVKYEKTDEIVLSQVGDVYTYNLIANGENIGKAHIHKETGILTYLESEGQTLTVVKMSLTNLPIPDYK